MRPKDARYRRLGAEQAERRRQGQAARSPPRSSRWEAAELGSMWTDVLELGELGLWLGRGGCSV